jgi:hypothetical protein
MTFILAYNRTEGAVTVDQDRVVGPRDFIAADKSDPLVVAALARGTLREVPVTFDPDGNGSGIKPEAFRAAGEVKVRNGQNWSPAPAAQPPLAPQQVEARVREAGNPGSLVRYRKGHIVDGGAGVRFPVFTTAELESTTTAYENGDTVFNSTLGKLVTHVGGEWV